MLFGKVCLKSPGTPIPKPAAPTSVPGLLRQTLDPFLILVWHLSNSIWNTSISIVKSSWTSLFKQWWFNYWLERCIETSVVLSIGNLARLCRCREQGRGRGWSRWLSRVMRSSYCRVLSVQWIMIPDFFLFQVSEKRYCDVWTRAFLPHWLDKIPSPLFCDQFLAIVSDCCDSSHDHVSV